MRGLYPIINVTPAHTTERVMQLVRAGLSAEPALLQLRTKQLPRPEVVRWATTCMEWMQGASTQLVINDAPDVAAEVGAPWVHVGQSDASVGQVRADFPHLRVGVSTHNRHQVAVALSHRPDYIAIGPVYATRTKADAEPVVGVPGLAIAFEQTRGKVPLVAIGGIGPEQVVEVRGHCDLFSVVSALKAASHPDALAKAMQQCYGEGLR